MLSNEEFAQVFKDKGLITDSQAEELKALAISKRVSVYSLILDKQLLRDNQIAGVMAKFYGVPLAPLDKMVIKKEILNLVPEVLARTKLVVPFAKDKRGLSVALSDPNDLELIEFIRKKTGEEVIPYYATPNQIDEVLRSYQTDVKEALKKVSDEAVVEAKKRGRQIETPIIKIVDTLLFYGEQNHASDIHIEPEEEASLVRYRIDGVLHDVAILPKNIHEELVTRIKILSNLRTDEHFAAQDGKLSFRAGFDLPKERQQRMDVRVSIVPTTYGEKVVLRLLSARVRQFTMTDMGFSPQDLEKIKSAYEKPYGMIVASGPTGSGKTTTMYAVLKMLNKRSVNITTIEDPVEYEMEGVNQIQVNTKTGLTFANGLRSIVRQDPDIILVGEIRDPETSDIAVNAAMTGHLVLTTMHSNDAATTFIRLLDMGVEPFLVASSVNVVIAQRLLRALCPQCKMEKLIATSDLKKRLPADLIDKYFGSKAKAKVWSPQGCPFCQHTGYTERIGIHEVLLVDEEIREAIIARRDAETIEKMAIAKGMTTMLEDGLIKIASGVTSVEEILRVTKE